MEIEELTGAILEEANREAGSVVSAAEKEAKETVSREKRRLSEQLADAERDAKSFNESQHRERIAWARLEAKRVISEAKEAVVDDAIEDLFALMRKFPQDRRYPAYLKRLVKAGIAELGEPRAVVHVRKADKKHLAGVKATVKADLDAFGGAVVESSDGRVSINLTLASLLEERKELVRKRIYEALFKR